VAVKRALIIAAAIAALAVPLSGSSTTGLVPAHSHWDGVNNDYELKFSFTPQAAAAGAGTTFGWIPFRAQDSQEYLQLDLTTAGYKLEKRFVGGQTVIAPDFKTAQKFGAGTEMLADLVVQGSSITLYAMSDTQARGAKLYHWTSTLYPHGKYISYYTQLRWFGYWEFVHEIPLDSSSEPHDILDLTQDARATSSPGGSATFDDPHPSSGGATNRGHTETYGIAHAGVYTFVFNVSGSGTGHADFLDPAVNGKFFAAGFYRLNVGAKSTLQRMTGSGTLAQTWALSQSGAGVYTVALNGSQVTVSKGATVVGHGSGGPSSGIRLRISAPTQTWVWTGATQ
jgi:hypothetical protein